MIQVHPTAVISSKASIGENIIISPFAVIEDDVVIGNDCYIGPHAVIYNGARIGNRVKIYQGVSLSNHPQDFSYKGEETKLIIDDDTTIREFATLHKGSITGYSSIGKNCFIMAYSHIAHDCRVGDKVVLANAVQLGGHVHLGEFAIIGGGTVVHQFCKIGQHSMTGGGYRVTQDIPPYILAAHEPLSYTGLNVVGLRRRGFSNDDIALLKKAYGFIYDKSLNVSQAKEKISLEFGDHPLIKNILSFLAESKRGIIGK